MIANLPGSSPATKDLTRLKWTMVNACWRVAPSSPPVQFIVGCPLITHRNSKAPVFITAPLFVESQLCRNEEVTVVGGGNSAGQAAIFLAQTSKCVHMLVRSEGLAASMSRYLIRRIEENPAIDLRTCSEIMAVEGTDHLEHVRWRDNRTKKIETRDVRHIFVMAGAIPNTIIVCSWTRKDSSGREPICREKT
jgi:Pyridine nucleotide-disulphide oxidoreductase